MSNQQFNIDALIKFNLAFGNLYTAELKIQNIFKEILDLQRKNTHNHKIQPQLSAFAQNISLLGRFHNYYVLEKMHKLHAKLNPEIVELLNMHLRKNSLLLDHGFLTRPRF